MIEYHKKSGADMTFAVKNVELTREKAKNNTLLTSDENGRITDVLVYPTDFEGRADITLNMVVVNTSYLRQIVTDSIAHDYKSLSRDIIARNYKKMNYRVYRYDGISPAFPLSSIIISTAWSFSQTQKHAKCCSM